MEGAELVALSPPRDVERVAGTDDGASVLATSRKDFRVRCTSKRAVTEMLELCGCFVQKLGDALPEEIREPVLRDAQWVRAQSCLITPCLHTPGLSGQKERTAGFGRVNGAPHLVRSSPGHGRERSRC